MGLSGTGYLTYQAFSVAEMANGQTRAYRSRTQAGDLTDQPSEKGERAEDWKRWPIPPGVWGVLSPLRHARAPCNALDLMRFWHPLASRGTRTTWVSEYHALQVGQRVYRVDTMEGERERRNSLVGSKL